MTLADAERRLPASARWRRAVSNGRVTAVLILLPPALILFTMFVTLPLGESAWYSPVQLERLRHAIELHRHRELSSGS